MNGRTIRRLKYLIKLGSGRLSPGPADLQFGHTPWPTRHNTVSLELIEILGFRSRQWKKE